MLLHFLYNGEFRPLGISAPVGEFLIDVRHITLTKLRDMIQYNQSEHMKKRSIMFQEALFIMGRLPNYYNRPRDELNKYQFGFMRKDNQQVKLIKPSRESEPIASLIGAADFFLHDIVIVPLSQIPPGIDNSVDRVPYTGSETINSSTSSELSSSAVGSPSGKSSSAALISSPSKAIRNKLRSRQRASIEAARASANQLDVVPTDGHPIAAGKTI